MTKTIAGFTALFMFASALGADIAVASEGATGLEGEPRSSSSFSSSVLRPLTGSDRGMACLLQVRVSTFAITKQALHQAIAGRGEARAAGPDDGSEHEVGQTGSDSQTVSTTEPDLAEDIVQQVVAAVDDPKVDDDGETEANDSAKEEIAELTDAIVEEQSVIVDAEKVKAAEKDHSDGPDDEPNETEKVEEVKEEIVEKVEKAIDDKIDTAHSEGRNPTEDEINQAVTDELSDMLDSLKQRSRYAPRTIKFKHGVLHFFHSVALFDWMLLMVAFITFLCLYKAMLRRPSTSNFEWLGLLVVWVVVASLYCGLISLRQGWNDGLLWMEGYLLEIIFMTENIFVLHIVVQAFGSPRKATEEALFWVVLGQVTFQMVFYMGLAHTLRSLHILPYVLGVWLIYVGIFSATSDEDSEFDFQDSNISRLSKACLGDRLSLNGMQESDFFIKKEDQRCLTQFGLMVVWLLIVDFCLEVDVTVAKIETMPNQYLAFSSSVVATFAVPEIFFIAKYLFERCKGLKYGIGVVLVLFGLEMLLHRFIEVPAFDACIAMIVIMLASGLLSFCFDRGPDSPLDIQYAAAASSN